MINKTVPLLFFGIIKQQLNIPLLCPANVERGCMNTGEIKDLNQRDYRHSKNPWRYQCSECEKYFYAHTSKLFRTLAIKQQLLIMCRIAKSGSKLSNIAEEFSVSEAVASRLASKFREFIENKLRKKYGYYILNNNIRKFKTAESQSIIVDETFVKIGKKQHYIIVAINGYGEIICWKLVESRNYKEVVKLLFLLFEEVGDIELLVTDAFSSYPKALRCFPRSFNLIHVQHIHKHPRGSIRVRYIEKHRNSRACIEYEWLTQSQIFKKYDQPRYHLDASHQALATVRLTLFRLKNYRKPVRRKIRASRRANSVIQQIRSQHKCCGTSKYYSDGQVFLFKDITMSFQINYEKCDNSKDGEVNKPRVIIDRIHIPDGGGDLTTMKNCNCLISMIAPVFTGALMQISLIYSGKSITSNLIESIFGRLDLCIPRSGNHDFESYEAVFSTWFSLLDQNIDLLEIASASETEIAVIVNKLINDSCIDEEIHKLFSRSSIYSIRNLQKAVEYSYWDP